MKAPAGITLTALTLCVAALGITTAVATSPVTPSVYFSNSPNLCNVISGTQYFVYVHAPDDPDITGVSFDLSLSAVATPVVEPIVLPYGAAYSISVDTSSLPYHVEATWVPHPQSHDPVLYFLYTVDPQFAAFQTPLNVEFTRLDGSTVPGHGIASFAGCCIDCFPCSVGIFADSHVLVPEGETTAIPFEWSWYCYATGGYTLNVGDTEGWVTSIWPPQAGDYETCSLCVVPRYGGSVEVSVPAGTPPGTTSTVTISTAYGGGGATFVVEVEEPVSTQTSTWGRIKALYR